MKGERSYHRGAREGVAFANEGLWENQAQQKAPLTDDFLNGFIDGCKAVIEDAKADLARDKRKRKS